MLMAELIDVRRSRCTMLFVFNAMYVFMESPLLSPSSISLNDLIYWCKAASCNMHSIHFIRESFEKVSEDSCNGRPRTLIMIKIIDLRRTGNNARLTVECLNGKTFNFQPARRELARATAAANAAVHWTAFKVDLPKHYSVVDVAVQDVLPPLITVDTCPSYNEEVIQLPLPNNHLEIFEEVK